jgi:hypothetical protein
MSWPYFPPRMCFAPPLRFARCIQSSAALRGEPVDDASAAFLHSLVSNTGAGAALLVKLARFAPDRQVVQPRVRTVADEAARLWLAVLLKHLGRTALAMADAEAPADSPAQRQLVEAWKKVGRGRTVKCAHLVCYSVSMPNSLTMFLCRALERVCASHRPFRFEPCAPPS